LTRDVEIFIGQKFRASEQFLRARFAQMFRRCIAFSALLPVRREKLQPRFAAANPHYSAKNCVFVVPQADCDGSRGVNDMIAGLCTKCPITAPRLLCKLLFNQENYWRGGGIVQSRPHTAAAPIA
jgi:hypothetical protein